MKKRLICVFLLVFSICLTACGDTKTTQDIVTLKIIGNSTTNLAIEEAISRFEKTYTNTRIEYEYMQNYDALLEKRLSCDAPDVDLFLNNGIIDGDPLAKYCINLFDIESDNNLTVDYSDTLDCIVKPYIHEHMYSIPEMANVYGVYVNKTLLNSYGISVPSNHLKFITALERMREEGYVPIQGNPSDVVACFAYANICRLLEEQGKENVDSLYGNCENADMSDILSVFYDYVDKGYVVAQNPIVDTNDNDYNLSYNNSDEIARSFFNIKYDESARRYVKEDDTGRVPFLIASMNFTETLNNCKQEYQSEIEYEFILLPLSDASGYAYIIPMNGISICKSSKNIDYAVEFLNFVLKKEENVSIAKVADVFPNVYEINKYINQRLGVPEKFIFNFGQLEFEEDKYALLVRILEETNRIYGVYK